MRIIINQFKVYIVPLASSSAPLIWKSVSFMILCLLGLKKRVPGFLNFKKLCFAISTKN